MERVKGVEPSAFSLATRHSTTELHLQIGPTQGFSPRSNHLSTDALSGFLVTAAISVMHSHLGTPVHGVGV